MSLGWIVGLDADGTLKLLQGRSSSTGAADAGRVVILGPNGLISPTQLPPGQGGLAMGMIAAEALSAGQLVNIHVSSGAPRVRRADASNARPADGFVLNSCAAGEEVTVYGSGQLITGLANVTPGVNYVLGWTTAGSMVPATSFVAAPGRTYQPVAVGATSTSAIFLRGEPLTLVA